MVEHPGMWAGILSLFRVGTVAGLMRILPMVGRNRLGAGKHGVRAGLGKRLEYRKGANESTRALAHNICACDELFVARGFIPAGLRSSPKKVSGVVSDAPRWLVLGPLRGPAGINPLATTVFHLESLLGFQETVGTELLCHASTWLTRLSTVSMISSR